MVYLEQYRIGIEVEPSVSHMAIGHPFFLFYSFGHSALFGFCAAAAKVSVILCPRCANMATANKYNQLMERKRVSFLMCTASLHCAVFENPQLLIFTNVPEFDDF